MSDFAWLPSNQSTGKRQPKTIGVAFEDYEQEAPDGMNNNPLEYDFVFTGLTLTELGSIDTFLSGKGGWQSFTFTPPAPHASEIKVKCKNWSWIYEGGLIVGLAANFKQSFAP